MIIKITELEQSKIKEIERQIDNGHIHIPKYNKGNPKRIYKNDEEYIKEKTEKWKKDFKKKYQQGKINNVIDIMNMFIRTQTEKQVEQ